MDRYLERISGLAGRTAVLIGTSKRLGAGIAEVLAAEGASVVINYASNERANGDKIAAEIRAKGGNAIAVHGNYRDAEDVERIFAETKRAYGRLDVLITNASVYEQAPANRAFEEGYQRHIWMNLLGTLLATREATKLFGAEGGSVFNINAMIGDFDPRTSSFYIAVKTALDSVARTFAKDLNVKKIQFSSIDIVVQLPEQGLNRSMKGNPMVCVENRLVEHLSNDIRFWALRLESGRINTFIRLDRAGSLVENARMFGGAQCSEPAQVIETGTA